MVPLKFALLLSGSLIVLILFCNPVHSLNIGLDDKVAGAPVNVSKDCSRKCESEFCTVPPVLRYGKYCGLLYSGCPGEKPCDGLDACCMKHDACVTDKKNGYLGRQCSKNLISCMATFKKSGGQAFKGSKCKADEVIKVITDVMKAALLAGKYFHHPIP
ncbi:Phospholipase A2-alpha [Morella rubra]|uniref:phospholipase A2 n=1 Tax=Morella rubra TaxID=262757 RepID=A0A6A1UXG7_9ROSI|nr:Phospholipase A2-alpha [Morella rubra]